MATTPNKNNPAPRPATSAPTAGPQYVSPLAAKRSSGSSVGNAAPLGNQVYLFDKTNYMWMLGGLAVVLLGFILMAGGKSPDPHVFNAAEIYSTRRITIAPILILLGFAIEVYAIMKKPASLHQKAADAPLAS